MEEAPVLLPRWMSISPWSLLRLSKFQLATIPFSRNFWKIPRWKMLPLMENLKPKLNEYVEWFSTYVELPLSITFKNSPSSHPIPDQLSQNHWGWDPGFHSFLTTPHDFNRQPTLRNMTVGTRERTNTDNQERRLNSWLPLLGVLCSSIACDSISFCRNTSARYKVTKSSHLAILLYRIPFFNISLCHMNGSL